MAQAPAMPMFVDAYMADTMHLSEAEDGVYWRLLMCMWRMEAKLPNDDDRLARFVRVSKAKWVKKYRPIMEPFFTISDDFWTQKRLKKEWEYVQQNAQRSRENGKRGGRPKSLENNETENPAGYSQDNPEHNLDGTQTKSPHPHTQYDDNTPDGVSSSSAREDDDFLSDDLLAYLTADQRHTERAVRGFVGQWLIDVGQTDLGEIIQTARASARGSPVAYIGRCVSNRKAERASGHRPVGATPHVRPAAVDENDRIFDEIRQAVHGGTV